MKEFFLSGIKGRFRRASLTYWYFSVVISVLIVISMLIWPKVDAIGILYCIFCVPLGPLMLFNIFLNID